MMKAMEPQNGRGDEGDGPGGGHEPRGDQAVVARPLVKGAW